MNVFFKIPLGKVLNINDLIRRTNELKAVLVGQYSISKLDNLPYNQTDGHTNQDQKLSLIGHVLFVSTGPHYQVGIA